MSDDEPFRHNPAKYRAMSAPHATRESADEAMQAFFRDVAAAREKWRIADVHVVIQTPCFLPTGDEGMVGMSLHLGDARNALPMCSREYARERQVHRAYLDRLLALTDSARDEHPEDFER